MNSTGSGGLHTSCVLLIIPGWGRVFGNIYWIECSSWLWPRCSWPWLLLHFCLQVLLRVWALVSSLAWHLHLQCTSALLKSMAVARQENLRPFSGDLCPLKHIQAREVRPSGDVIILKETRSLAFLPFILAGVPTRGPGQPLLGVHFLISLCSLKRVKCYTNVSC